MTETAVEAVATPAKSKKSLKTPKAKSATKKAATHPPTAQMVNAAIKSLKERGGSSLQAIKKYVSSTYKVDAEKVAPFIKKYLKQAVDNGSLIQTKGQGASGSFKLPIAKTEGTKKPVAKKPKAAKKAVKAKKEKVAATPKAAKPKTTKPKAAKKSPSKAKKATKAPAAKKPKSPKPKKVVAKKVAKKPAAKK